MKTRTCITAASLMAIACAAFGQAQFSNSDTFKPVLGRWQTKEARFSSTTSEVDQASSISDWTGGLYGVIKPSGELLFKAANGCVISGLATPFASNAMWAFNGKLEGCTLGHLNQRIFGNLRKEGGEVIVEASDVPFAFGRPPVSYYLKARMTPY